MAKTKSMTKSEKAWTELFEKYDIVESVNKNGFFDINSKMIKSAKGKPEPRLMCKMDFREAVPKPFVDNNLSILAIANGVYRIAGTQPFFDLDLKQIAQSTITDFSLPPHIETLAFDNITSESQALDAAVASGMLERLLGEETFLTVRGRKYCSKFELSLVSNDNQNVTYKIQSVQIEVDGGYEGKNTLALIEAKMGSSDNMNMRQLIYPHKHFETNVGKTVKTFVMFYETGSIFTFIPMKISLSTFSLDYEQAKRFRLIKSHRQKISNPKITLPKPGHGAPFPQADDFEKVMFGFYKIAEDTNTETETYSELPIVPRQYNYYFNAARWLGLVEKDGRGRPINLTSLGEKLIELSERDRLKALHEIILSNEVVQHIISNPDEPLPLELKRKHGLVGKSMYPRRKKTIESWLKYFDNLSFT